MTVQIDFDSPGTEVDDGGESGFLILRNPERDEHYASWPFHVNPDAHHLSEATNVWKWENPSDPIEDITLSPSLRLDNDSLGSFHIYIRDGEIEHCGDCQCGCSE